MTTIKKQVVKDDFDSSNEVQSNWIKWNVVGEDKILGTLTAKRTMKSSIPGKEGDMVNIYDMKIAYGSFHVTNDKKVVVEEPVVIEEGEMYSIGGTNVIDRQMTNVKVGQIIGLKYNETVPSKTKGFAPAKIIKVFLQKNDDGSLKMDDEWIAENANPDSNFDKM